MNIIEGKQVLQKVYEHRSRLNLLFWGRHGTGKTEMLQQFADFIDYKLIIIELAQADPVDILGPLETFYSEELGCRVSRYCPPEHFVRAIKQGKVILFFDELNRARKETVNAVHGMFQNRAIGGVDFHETVMMVAACNPDNSGNYHVSELDPSFLNRFVNIHFKPDVNVWLDWGKQKNPKTGRQNIHPTILNYVRNSGHKAAYYATDEDDKFPIDKIEHSLRSWKNSTSVKELELPEALERECLRGLLDVDHAYAYVASLACADAPLTLEEILGFNEQAKSNMEKWNNPDKIRADLFAESLSNLTDYIKKMDDANEIEKTLEYKNEILGFLSMLPDDLLGIANETFSVCWEWAKVMNEDQVFFQRLLDASKVLKINQQREKESESKKVFNGTVASNNDGTTSSLTGT